MAARFFYWNDSLCAALILYDGANTVTRSTRKTITESTKPRQGESKEFTVKRSVGITVDFTPGTH